jgi:hypothetical protein
VNNSEIIVHQLFFYRPRMPILIADEEFRVGERASEDEKCIAFFTASQ